MKPLEPEGDLEKLLAAHREMQWNEKLRNFRLDQGYLFRGLFIYRQVPVCIPGGNEARLQLHLDSPIKLTNWVRIKVLPAVHSKKMIEIT